MKLLHTADLHLGKSLCDFDLTEDQEYILHEILELAIKENADGILIAGDVYDKKIPSEAATALLDNFLKELQNNGIKVFMISGNHDSNERLNFGSSLFETNQIYISSIFDGMLHKQSIDDGKQVVDVYLLPFVKASTVKHFFPDAEIANYEDAIKIILEHTELNKDHFNILVAHQFVVSEESDPCLSGSESAGTQCVGLVEKIHYDCFNDFDYVALGHIHSSQRIGRDEVRYSGSPLKYSLSEAYGDKSVTILTITEDKDVKIEMASLKPKRNLRHVRGKLSELLDANNVRDADDFIYATLTEDQIVDNAMGVLRTVYKNAVRIEYYRDRKTAKESVEIGEAVQARSFTEMISEFYEQIYGQKITDDEIKVIKEVAREVGVIDEAD